MLTTLDFQQMKKEQRKISMVTCYDYTFAQIIDQSSINMILVGDSAAMVMHGHSTTIQSTLDMMVFHTSAVVRGAPHKFIVSDMPFLSHRLGLPKAMEAVISLMQAGAHAVKIEGAEGHLSLIHHIVESGVPVMGHIGLTPQSFHQLGGFKIQGREKLQQERIYNEAKELQDAGCFAIVLECIPYHLAQKISQDLSIPTIGIGAGLEVDGQVLVLQDLLGMNDQFKPKFVRHFLNGKQLILHALEDYHNCTAERGFPNKEEWYS